MKQTNRPIYNCKHMAHLRVLAGSCLILLASNSLLAPARAESGVYKWVNEYDEIQYTQMPPPHGITAIRIQSAPQRYADEDDAGTPPPAETAGNTVDDGLSDTGQGEAVDTTRRDAEIARSMKENCKNARKNLASLSRGNIRFLKPSGEAYRLTEEERQQRIEEANDQIKLLCKG